MTQARALAEQLGLIDRTVLFLDEWVPYEDRHDYLREADLGVTLHRFTEEAELAARARYMDYLSAALPCVLGRGDETAADFEQAGFATLLDQPDPQLLATTLLALIDDPERLENAAAAGERLADERRWSSVGVTLRAALASVCERRPSARRQTLSVMAQTGSYYAGKLRAPRRDVGGVTRNVARSYHAGPDRRCRHPQRPRACARHATARRAPLRRGSGVEWIVVDSGSSDGTPDAIEKSLS